MRVKVGTLMMAAALTAVGVQADSFGSGGNEFELTFQGISGGSNPSSGYGQVGYDYGIGTHEITADQWQKYVNASGGPVGTGSAYDSAPTTSGSQAVDYASWYEAAQLVNWLNTSKGHQAAYSFDGSGAMSLWGAGDQSATSAFRHKDAVYVLPSENEWVKAGYWNGTTLQTYATPGDTLPAAGAAGANYNNAVGSVWNVGTGAEELNGTFDMMGNVWEWNESGFTAPDDSATESRCFAAGRSTVDEDDLRSSNRLNNNPSDEYVSIGFRVAAIPEPSSLAMVGVACGLGLFIRRKFML